MSNELAEAEIVEAPAAAPPEDAPGEKPRRASRSSAGLSDPSAAFLMSGIVWLSLVAGLIQTAGYVPGSTEISINGAKESVWFGLFLAGFVVAVAAAVVYITDRKQRRNTFPRGYRAPEGRALSIIEAIGWLALTAYTVAVVASAVWLSMAIVERYGTELVPPTVGQIALLVVIAGVYLYLLIVLPAVGLTVPLMRRHRRRYPDDRDHEDPGYPWTSRSLLLADALLIAIVVLVEVLDAMGRFAF